MRRVEEEGPIKLRLHTYDGSNDAKICKQVSILCLWSTQAPPSRHLLFFGEGRWGGPTKHGIYNWELSGIQRSMPQLPSNDLGTMNYHLHTSQECQV